MRRASRIGLFIGIILGASAAHGQGTKADFSRAEGLREQTRGKVARSGVQPHWFSENKKFWYENTLGDGTREYVVVDAVHSKREPAFDHAKLWKELEDAKDGVKGTARISLDALRFEGDGSVVIGLRGKGWRFDPKAGTLTSTEPPKPELSAAISMFTNRGPRRGGARRSDTSPDGKWTISVRKHNLILRAKDSDRDATLTTEGTDSDGYEPRVFWSPDSKSFVALRTAKGDERKVNLIESSPKSQLQPKLSWYEYLKPGDKIAVTKPHLFDVASAKEVAISGDLFPTPWSINEYRWSPDSTRFTFVYNQRGHQVRRLVAIDRETGDAKALFDEQSKTFVDYSQKHFSYYLDKTGEILWMSERNGWNHLYLINEKTGEITPITSGEFVVRAVDRVDEDARQVWFRAGGIHPDQDPYYIHFARVSFDGSNLTHLTEGDGTHQLVYSPDRAHYIDTYSRVDMPPVAELRRTETGKLVCALEKADWSALLATGWKAPERFVAKGRDGKTDIFGVIFRPTNHDPSHKYPVIEQIYAGPQGAFVPKAFSALSRLQSLAELGFIVVQIDGMGTNWRSKAFHDVCWKNLGDAGLPDRILWMKAAAKQDPSMDITRVGVYGGSAGGQNALGALLFHPEFYKVGAADCGCHDNRMDKIWWNEAWMGWPIGPHYSEQSNVTNAHKLQGKLLLTVGELDHNVDPSSTMQVVNALIKANKDFDLIVFPGADHGAGGGRYGDRRRQEFFVRHLLGVEPKAH